MTTGPTDGKVTTAAGGPDGMPLALRFSEGLGPLPQTFAQWAESLSVEARYDFDSDGRGYRKDSSIMMNLAWDAAVAAERERCAKLCDDSNVFEYDDPGGFFANLIRGPAA